jgi:hypothetical protein
LRSLIRIIGSIVMVATVAVSVSACSVPTTGTTSTPDVGVNAPSASSASSLPALNGPMTSTAAQPASDQAAFGETYKWANGLEVTISGSTPFTPSEYVVTDKPAVAYLSYSVTIVNKTGATYEPTLFSTSVQSGDTEGNQIFDSANGFTGPPSTAILNGRQSTFTVGYGVSNPADIVMQVSPGFDYKKTFFTS